MKAKIKIGMDLKRKKKKKSKKRIFSVIKRDFLSVLLLEVVSSLVAARQES